MISVNSLGEMLRLFSFEFEPIREIYSDYYEKNG